MLAEMSSQHAIYIPAVVLLGLILGYIAGLRAARAEELKKRERLKK
jgi:hypothetical protein